MPAEVVICNRKLVIRAGEFTHVEELSEEEEDRLIDLIKQLEQAYGKEKVPEVILEAIRLHIAQKG
ncbi:hypothetical protein DRP07_00355 [Archaeoglobales archaeon]|nr:MAG: hypothetical protein DRP07_00355 [Archaeoglobales archaeon]